MRKLFIGLLALGGLLVLGLGIVLTWPSILLTDGVNRWILSQILPQDWQLDYRDLDVEVHSFSLWRKHLKIDVVRARLKIAENVSIDFPHAEVQGVINFAHWPPALEELGPALLVEGVLKYREAPESAKPAPKTSEPTLVASLRDIESIFRDLQEFSLRKTTVSFRSLDLSGKGWSVEGLGSVVAEGDKHSVALKTIARASVVSGRDQFTGETQLSLQPHDSETLVLSWTANVKKGKRDRWDLELRGNGKGLTALQYEGALTSRTRGKITRVRAKGFWKGAEHVHLALQGELPTSIKEIPDFSFKPCSFDLYALRSDMLPGRWNVQCGFRASVRAPIQEGFSGKVQSFGELHGNKFEGVVQASAKSTERIPIELSGRLDSQLAGDVRAPLDQAFSKSSLQVEGRIRAFRSFVDWMSRSQIFDLPQPLRELQGTVTAKVSATAGAPWELNSIPWVIQSRLAGSGQQLNFEGKGKVLLSEKEQKRVHLEGSIALNEVELQLPKLDPWGLPRLLPDSRISAGSRDLSKEKSAPFTYDLKIYTAQRHPLRLRSNLAGKPVPLELSLHLRDNQPPVTLIEGQPFPLKVFRREADVKKLVISRGEQDRQFALSSQLDVSYTDYIIHVSLLGQLDQPVVRLSSDPPLPQDRILAVLFFGRDIADLDPDQRDSVSGIQAAVTDRAVSLASLYLLASTPIETLGYDPQTGTVYAKIRLGDGTSLSLGSKAGTLQQVGLRRRLSSEWSVSTYVKDPNKLRDDANVAAGAFLEWNRRY